MRPFELVAPRSLAEAVRCLDRTNAAIRPIGGGTALMLMMKSGFFRPDRLVSLHAVESRFRTIATGDDGSLHIGAMATLSAIEHAPLVARHAPVVTQALRTLANVRIRNVATLGGHLAHADPHLDLPPILVALQARLVILGPAGERTIPVEALFHAYLQTTLSPDEIIAAAIVPDQRDSRAVYMKCTARSADDWPALGVAVAVGSQSARIVVGAATEKPTRLAAAEALVARSRDASALRQAADAAADEAPLISDQHGSAAYKKELLRVSVRRALQRVLSP
jgi:aerobic carbon-monoxide dehydrogenase medium subunit